MSALNVLVVDDEAYVRDSVAEVLSAEGFGVRGAASVAEALRVLSSELVHVVLCDLKMPTGDGRTLLHESRRAQLGLPIIMITGAGTIADAVEAMKAGAYDFLQKPVDPDELVLTVRRAAEHFGLIDEVARLRAAAQNLLGARVLVGSSAALQRVRAVCAQVAATDATVLISGESGTGKELAAVEIHRRSARAQRPLVQVNCAAIDDDRFEREFFGHGKGALDAAGNEARGESGRELGGDRAGRFAQAAGGTLVLDGIGSLSLAQQAKLLRVLESGEYQRVGESRAQVADVRVVAISNEDLSEKVKSGAFRSDLYYRIQVFPIEVPPLRQHKEDLPELAAHLLAGFRGLAPSKVDGKVSRIAGDALELLTAYDWPGNVRELRNVLERAAILVVGAEIGADVVSSILEPVMALAKEGSAAEFHLRRNLNAAERAILLRALSHAQNRRKEASALLGIDARNLAYYLRKHKISDADIRDSQVG